MFDNISGTYDFLNHFMSAGIDFLWRKAAIKILRPHQPKTILDIATGTGDFAVEAMSLKPNSIIGLDISPKMIELGKQKIAKKGLTNVISLEVGDSEKLRFKSETFDAVTVGFGVRNFEDTAKGLSEMLRVTKKGGTVIILEFSKPQTFPVKQAFGLYSRFVIPTVGKAVSKDASAYSYLPESVAAFPEGKAFTDLLTKVGYKKVGSKRLSGGIATIYYGSK